MTILRSRGATPPFPYIFFGMVSTRQDICTATFIQHCISFRSNVSNLIWKFWRWNKKYLYLSQDGETLGKITYFHPFKKPYLSASLLTWRLCEDVCNNTAKCYTSPSHVCRYRGEERHQTPRKLNDWYEHHSSHHVRKKMILVLCCIGVPKPGMSDYCFGGCARNVAQVTSILARPT
jgi:hypothetical protein